MEVIQLVPIGYSFTMITNVPFTAASHMKCGTKSINMFINYVEILFEKSMISNVL